MIKEYYDKALEAYLQNDFYQAAESFAKALEDGQISGEAYHKLGNSYMKLKQIEKAVEAYNQALADRSYPQKGAVSANLGKAYLLLGKQDEALTVYKAAALDPAYQKAYKAFTALAGIHESRGEIREAGAAYRSAALDVNNPDPSSALLNLGSCFMQLKRPADAVEAYRTALDVSAPSIQRNMVFAQLGRAYVAMSRMDEALSSFNQAMADGTYQLNEAALKDYEYAKHTLEQRRGYVTGSISSTDEMLSPLNQTNPNLDASSSGMIMPSPEDTGFFEITERDLVKLSKQQKKAERKHKHTGLKLIILILILLIAASLCAAYAYYKGYGIPSQQAIVTELFERVNADKDSSDLWQEGTDATALSHRMLELGKTKSVEVLAMDKNMQTSVLRVKATLVASDNNTGSDVIYLVYMIRSGISWKISDVHLNFDSLPQGSSGIQKASGALQDNKVASPAVQTDIVVPAAELEQDQAGSSDQVN